MREHLDAHEADAIAQCPEWTELVKEQRLARFRTHLARRLAHHCGDEAFYQRLDANRRAWIAHRDAMLVLQKACGSRGDKDGARFFKEEASEAMKTYRGCCAVLGAMFPDRRGDCPLVWPDDVAPEILSFAIAAHAAASLEGMK